MKSGAEVQPKPDDAEVWVAQVGWVEGNDDTDGQPKHDG